MLLELHEIQKVINSEFDAILCPARSIPAICDSCSSPRERNDSFHVESIPRRPHILGRIFHRVYTRVRHTLTHTHTLLHARSLALCFDPGTLRESHEFLHLSQQWRAFAHKCIVAVAAAAAFIRASSSSSCKVHYGPKLLDRNNVAICLLARGYKG